MVEEGDLGLLLRWAFPAPLVFPPPLVFPCAVECTMDCGRKCGANGLCCCELAVDGLCCGLLRGLCTAFW